MSLRMLLALLLLPLLVQAQEQPGIGQEVQLRDETLARIITSGGLAGECISPLAVTRIDGEDTAVSRHEFEILPGPHRLNGRTTMNMTHCQPLSGEDRLGRVEDLEAQFEAGMTYFVGFDHSNADLNEWKIVIWMVEEG